MKKIIIPGLIAGIAMFVVSLLTTQVFNFIVPGLAGQYQNSALFRPWSDPLMTLFFLYPFIMGQILAYLWTIIKKSPLNFALIYWLIASVPGMFVTYTSFVVSLPMVISWSVAGFLEALVAGLIFLRLGLK